MEDMDLYPDELYEEEEEAIEEEGINRRFIILIGALAIPLVLAVCAFIAYITYFGPRMAASRLQPEDIEATNIAALATEEAVPTETSPPEMPPTETPAPAPTNTPQPTPTKEPTDTPVAAEALSETVTATPGEAAEAATAAPTPTPTLKPAAGKGMPETGIGALGASALALGLVFLLVVVRRIRRAV